MARSPRAAAAASAGLYIAEPRPAFQARTPVVVDCSAVVSSLFEEADTPAATDALRAHDLHAPALLPFEFANVARSKSRAGAPPERVAMALQAFSVLRIELHPIDVTDMHAAAMQHGVTAYDAAYLALAVALQAPLLTFDRKLAEAATRALGGKD